ncbi:proton-conducting transporter membrane subunit [Falsiroseomonas sp.]|uniref:proton-conducting transporter transmembrane domain-containing protein n=1 Tax=Falsiroseomonas sp. TaxID=2870721 RepID=UPI002717D0C9|nr:proton-conducting transporter membrane subunit [Falsiroseomonas sp.]MDO9501212.1 proton-conducting transporter membrane subunit [Falsiroseomonas sp.]
MTLHLPWLIVFFPWAGAALLAGLAPRGRWPALVNLGVSGVSCALALALLAWPEGVQGWTRVDAVNQPLVALAGIIGLATAVFSAATVDAERFDALRARAYHAAFQLFMGAQFLALLSDNLGVMWVAIEIATLASVLIVAVHGTPAAIEAAWKFFLLCGVGIALALFGTILLYLAAQPVVGQGDPGLSWAALRAVAQQCDPGILSLAFVFLVVGYGTKAGLVPLHAWLPDAEAEGPLPITAVLSGLLLNAALVAILRAKAIVDLNPGVLAPGPLLIGFGLASLLLAALALWRRRDARRFFAWSSIEHMGLSAIAFGLGANLAGMLHLMGHSLVKSAVFFGIGAAAQIKGSQKMADIGGLATSHPALGWALALGIAGLAGLPPFSLFVSEFRLVVAAAAVQPWLVLPMGIGLLVAGTALVRALQALCLGPPTPDAPVPGAFTLPGGLWWASGPAWALLALAALLGFALPAWFTALLGDAVRLLG